MKTTKIIAAVMAMTMTMGLCACGDSADSGTTDSKSTKSTVAQDKSQSETTASNEDEHHQLLKKLIISTELLLLTCTLDFQSISTTIGRFTAQ